MGQLGVYRNRVWLSIAFVCTVVVALAYGEVTDTATAGAVADVLLGVGLLALVSITLADGRANGALDRVAAAAFLVAACAVGYVGLAGLSPGPGIPEIRSFGNVALLVAAGLLLYRAAFGERNRGVPD